MQPDPQLSAAEPPPPEQLLRLAQNAAAKVLDDPILVEEAAERALHKLFLICLEGRPPLLPEAWIRVAARRFAQSLRRRRRPRHVALDLDQLPQPELDRLPRAAVDHVLDLLQPVLTPRQLDAVRAMVQSRSMRDAARRCGMTPKSLRRSLGLVGEKGRATLAAASTTGAACPRVAAAAAPA